VTVSRRRGPDPEAGIDNPPSRQALAVAGGIMPSEPPLPTPVTDLLEGSEMSKKKRADIGKLVDAQAKGKKVTGSKIDKKTPEAGDLDVRTSKESQKAWLC
jgi:hypothetical protein